MALGFAAMNFGLLQTASNVAILVGAILAAFGAFGHFYFGHRIEEDRARLEAAAQHRQEAAEVAEAEEARRRQILLQLRQLYLLSHDGITPEMASGVAPLPKEWAEEQLRARGETWRQDQYF